LNALKDAQISSIVADARTQSPAFDRLRCTYTLLVDVHNCCCCRFFTFVADIIRKYG